MSINTEDNPRSIAKSAFGFVSGTMLSRITGLLRDMSMAFCFGTNPAVAAFFVAFRFANLLRRVFGEGALLTSFIPHFESYRNENPKQAALFFRDIFFSLIFSLLVLIGIIECSLYWCCRFEFIQSNQFIVYLTMLMMPGVLFICLYSICSGLLHCEKNFFLSGIAPVGFNCVWIAAVWLFRKAPLEDAVVALSLAITLAFCFQWLITLPKTLSFVFRYLSWKEFFHMRLFSLEIRQMISSLSIGVIGVGASQINSAIDTVFARYASLEGPAYLNYAIHLQQLPLALFGIGIASALLPPLSRAIKSEDLTRYRHLLKFSLTTAMTFLVPCCLGIFCLGAYAINLIYGRGDFNQESTMQTTYCLWGYGIGLIPMGLSLILTPAFYARRNYLVPTVASISSIFVNVCLNICFVFVFHYNAASLAFSTSLAAIFNVVLLFYFLSKKIELSVASLVISFLKISLCSFLAAIGVCLAEYFFLNQPSVFMAFQIIVEPFSRSFAEQFSHFFLLSGCFMAVFFFSSWKLNIGEIFQLFQLNKKSWQEV